MVIQLHLTQTEVIFVSYPAWAFLMDYRIHFLFTYSSFLINIHSTWRSICHGDSKCFHLHPTFVTKKIFFLNIIAEPKFSHLWCILINLFIACEHFNWSIYLYSTTRSWPDVSDTVYFVLSIFDSSARGHWSAVWTLSAYREWKSSQRSHL